MTEQKPLYRIVFKRSYPELQDEVNILVAQGYEVICYGPGNPDVHPSVVMRLCANEDFLGRMDELMALAQQIRNTERDMEARVTALEGWRPMANEDIENLEAQREVHLKEHDSIGIKAETLRNRVDRLVSVADAAHQGVQGALARLTEVDRHVDSIDATMADAVSARLGEIERRLQRLETGGCCETRGGTGVIHVRSGHADAARLRRVADDLRCLQGRGRGNRDEAAGDHG